MTANATILRRAIDPRATHVLFDLAPVEWEEWVERQIKIKGDPVMSQVADELTSLACSAARLAQYINCRTYPSDQGHDKAWKAALRRLKQVRKAMGFSYP